MLVRRIELIRNTDIGHKKMASTCTSKSEREEELT